MAEADILITGGIIVTLDDHSQIIEEGALAIKGEKIEALGRKSDLQARYRASMVLNADGCIVMPGLINAHTHAAMTLFRGMADDLPLLTWLNEYIFPAETHLTEEVVYTGTMLACAEMIKSGTTCFCDMYLFEHKVAEAAADAGMRAVVGEVLYDFPSPNYGPPEEGLRFSEELIRKWSGHPLVRIAVEPHSTYTCSPEYLTKIMEIALEYKVPYVIHLAESRDELAQVREKYGTTPVRHLESLKLLNDLVVADHSVWLDEEELEIYKNRGVKVAHCPESNVKLASGIAPVPEMICRGITVGLGTDGCASNNNLDMFQEMDSAAKIQKVIRMDPAIVDAEAVLRMATTGSAAALGMKEEIGSLEVGKRADVIVVDASAPHMTPLYDPVSQLVYSARGADVTHTIINGEIVMKDRKIVTFDEAAVMSEARAIAERINKTIRSKNRT